MAAPLHSLCNCIRPKFHYSVDISTKKRFLHLYCRKYQKKKNIKKNGIELDQLFSEPVGKKRTNPNNTKAESNDMTKVPSFRSILQKGYLEARKSILIRSQNAENTLQSLLLSGRIGHAQIVMPEKNFLLVEFANEMTPSKLIKNATWFSESRQFQIKSRLLCDTRGHQNKKTSTLIPVPSDGNWTTKTSDSYPVSKTLGEEMHALSLCRSLDDYDLRKRFFACLLLEDLIQPVVPGSRVVPYGSCLNGFGWWSSDLDMMLCLDGEPYSGLNMKIQNDMLSSQFKFVTEIFVSDRHLAQRTLAMVGSLLELTPRVDSIVKILNARVPIVRFRHQAVNLLCDVSVHSIDSIKMTEMLYLYSVSDPRVRPLMSTIKQWAVSQKLTSGGEQQKLTTIGLLMMLIFYLQTRSPPVVPTFRQIQSLAKPSEVFYIEDVKFSLPENPALLPKSQNSQTLENLLLGFFQFYSEFDFATKAISITEGEAFDKPNDSRPMCVENPLSVSLNVCQNVGAKPLEMVKKAMKEAVLKLEEVASARDNPGSKMSTLLSEKPTTSKLSVLFSCSNNEHSLNTDECESEESANDNEEESVRSDKPQSELPAHENTDKVNYIDSSNISNDPSTDVVHKLSDSKGHHTLSTPIAANNI